jgi:hypothetical protein
MSTELAPALLGTSLFAPQARLVLLDETFKPLVAKDKQIDQDHINQDIVSVTTTLLGNGISTVDIVLNNQRFSADPKTVKTTSPSWRYNKLDRVRFGSAIRIDMRYGGEGWTPMILARITDITFNFPSAAGAEVTLKGSDLLSLLSVKPDPAVPAYIRKHEMQMVKDEIAESGLTLATPVPGNAFTTPMTTLTHEPAKTRLEFIQSLADRMDFEVFVAFDDAAAGTDIGNRSVSLHFEPSRSAKLGKPVPLQWGLDIVDFKPVFKVWELYTGATIAGSKPRGRGGISPPPVTMAKAINDLHKSAQGSAPISAVTVRERAFAGNAKAAKNILALTAANLDQPRAELQATAASIT